MENINKYKPILWLIGKFFITYIALTILYSWYLQPYVEASKVADPFTEWVAHSTAWLMRGLGFDAVTESVAGEPYVRFYLDKVYSSYVNEGCNALSILIIYVSFIIAFAKKWVPTLVYLAITLAVLLIANLVRIAILNYIGVYHTTSFDFAHSIIFPAILYGMVVIFWLIWIKYFTFKETEK